MRQGAVFAMGGLGRACGHLAHIDRIRATIRMDAPGPEQHDVALLPCSVIQNRLPLFRTVNAGERWRYCDRCLVSPACAPVCTLWRRPQDCAGGQGFWPITLYRYFARRKPAVNSMAMRDTRYRGDCCRSCLRGSLRALNYLLAIIGVLMVAYALFMYVQWSEATPPGPHGSGPLPPPSPTLPASLPHQDSFALREGVDVRTPFDHELVSGEGAGIDGDTAGADDSAGSQSVDADVGKHGSDPSGGDDPPSGQPSGSGSLSKCAPLRQRLPFSWLPSSAEAARGFGRYLRS